MSVQEEASVYFNTVVGLIEDIVISSEFQKLQDNFLEAHYQQFDTSEENKIEYTDIFRQYTDSIEKFIVNALNEALDEPFDMELFTNELQRLKPVLEGEIFELLFSLIDFQMFKEMILDYKTFKEGNYDGIFSGITVKRLSGTDLTDGSNLSDCSDTY